MMSGPTSYPHRRYDPLRDRWLLVSPHRTLRPWDGEQEGRPAPEPAYSESCYLCPRNQRASGERNPDYEQVFVFDNDFPALLESVDEDDFENDSLFVRRAVRGRCRVICYSPRHDLAMSKLSRVEIEAVIQAWQHETRTLHEDYEWVQVFENRGSAMGCSNPHPHGQIWALDALPSEGQIEDRQQCAYHDKWGVPMLLRYALREQEQGERIVHANKHWVAVVPHWATWPFETLLLPLHPLPGFSQMDEERRSTLADILALLLRTYDRIFDTPFPYSMGWHGAPGGRALEYWQLHAHFYPPLLRSANIRKFMVGFEMLGEAQRDLTPEHAAHLLRAASEGSA